MPYLQSAIIRRSKFDKKFSARNTVKTGVFHVFIYLVLITHYRFNSLFRNLEE